MWRVLVFICVAVIISLSCETVLDDWYDEAPPLRPLEMKYVTGDIYLPQGAYKLVPCGGSLFAVIAEPAKIHVYKYKGDDKNPGWYAYPDNTGGTDIAFDAVCYNNDIIYGYYTTGKYNFIKSTPESAAPIGTISASPSAPEMKLAVYNGSLYAYYSITPGGQISIFNASKFDGTSQWSLIGDEIKGIHENETIARSKLRLAADTSGIYALYTQIGNPETLNIRRYSGVWDDVMDNGSPTISKLNIYSSLIDSSIAVKNGTPFVAINEFDSTTYYNYISAKQILPDRSEWMQSPLYHSSLNPLQILFINGNLTVIGKDQYSNLLGRTFSESTNRWEPLIGPEVYLYLSAINFHATVFNNKLYIIYNDNTYGYIVVFW
jgi:hypothetical protein